MELRVRIVLGDENSLCKVVPLQPGLWCAFFVSFFTIPWFYFLECQDRCNLKYVEKLDSALH